MQEKINLEIQNFQCAPWNHISYQTSNPDWMLTISCLHMTSNILLRAIN